jgi:hypothetical protein
MLLWTLVSGFPLGLAHRGGEAVALRQVARPLALGSTVMIVLRLLQPRAGGRARS